MSRPASIFSLKFRILSSDQDYFIGKHVVDKDVDKDVVNDVTCTRQFYHTCGLKNFMT